MTYTATAIPSLPTPLRDAALSAIQSWSYNNFGSMEPQERATRVAETLDDILSFSTKSAKGDAKHRRGVMIELLSHCLVPMVTAIQIADIFFAVEATASA